MKKKSYTVNVYYTMIHTMEVEASSEEEAQDIVIDTWTNEDCSADIMDDVDIDVTENS